jgi:hypothetical protein
MMRLRITSSLMMIVVMIWHQNQISPMHLSNFVSEPNYRERVQHRFYGGFFLSVNRP